ncbi:hypothetical protein COLO4_17485 [Corchorus olitorius]|uniref:non-specific serine/threonine protein kinase n=1 Tax=Corchorus olitorius TaxID=93759 RepID=A0A1R3JCK1_9ROSI|nr:hypothetical protein COLO4_17485 [Corchorus olitorius]
MLFARRLVLDSIFIACFLTSLTSGATLARDEGKTLGKTNWNFNIDPCSKDNSWEEKVGSGSYANNVTCDCTFDNNTTCHVVAILLKGQGLAVRNSLHINCGGQEVTVNGTSFEANNGPAGASTFVEATNNWGFSNTGHFLDDNGDDTLDVGPINQLSMADQEAIYQTARLSPISLTYYAYCLENRTYNVSLHFAEIQFTDGPNYTSLGRRIFDVYIQGNRVLPDFNIKDAAGGAGKPIVKKFTVNVTDGTLEIQFRWAGKGTISIPVRGVYGPLISAISIFDPDFKPPSKVGSSISAGAVAGVVAGAVFANFVILGILWWYGCLRRKSTLERDLKGIELQTTSFTLKQIKAATHNFDDANKIGEGGFGPVYKGTFEDGTLIAVKQLSAKSKQGNREFVTEIGMISALQHPHLVRLGYMAPEYAMHGHLSDKADVYSFGIVALEIVSGRCNTKHKSKEESFYLLDWAHVLKENGHLLDLIDPRIGSDCKTEEAMAMINVGLLCTNPTAAARPSMSSVVSVLEGRVDVKELVRNSSISESEMNVATMKKFYRQIEENDADISQTKSMLVDGPWTSSSTSAADLYPVNLSSSYFQNRDSSTN